ncbi:VVA0879 family protein [Actinophytocola sediminis]
MPSRTLTQAELVAEARAAFGDDPETWAFRCPNCADVAVAQDFRDAGADTGRLGQECIGRSLGALSGPPTTDAGKAIAKRGCDWAAYGLFPGPWHIEMPDGKRVPGFPLATHSEQPQETRRG